MPLNRTILELKRGIANVKMSATFALNRTILELKLAGREQFHNALTALNRTILELKLNYLELAFAFVALSIAPFWN